jgi:hypothetical protein
MAVRDSSCGQDLRARKSNGDVMPFIIFELLYVGLAAGFIGLVVLGHALLFGAIYKCVREDWAIGQRSNRKPALPDQAHLPIAARWLNAIRAFSGKVESGFPSENATNANKLEHIQFPSKLNVL